MYSVGGVWIPLDDAKPPRFFKIGGTEKNKRRADAGLGMGMVNAFIAAEKGKILMDREIHEKK